MDLKGIDLHLLACFDALMTERSVTHAANRMNLSQPAMSNALARMRELFNDQLLVRTNRGMTPTPRAEQLHGTIRQTLQALTGAFGDCDTFDPATAHASFNIAVTDYTSLIVLRRLLPLLRNEAPHVQLVLVPPDRHRIREWLEEGVVDVALGYFIELSEGLRATKLFNDPMCCIAAAGHPLIRGRIDLETYLACPHAYWGGATVHPFTMEMVVDRALEGMGLKRRIALRSLAAPVLAHAVESSDMIATMSRSGALCYAEKLDLQVLELPFALDDGFVSIVWHERTHRTASSKWFRDTLRRCWDDGPRGG